MKKKADIERGRALRARRDELGLSRPVLAEQLGVHRNTVLGWEQGRMPYGGHALQLRELYDLPEDFFAMPDAEAPEDAVNRLAMLLVQLQGELGKLSEELQELQRNR